MNHKPISSNAFSSNLTDIEALALHAVKVEKAKRILEAGSRVLSMANALGQPFRGRALGLYSKVRANYHHILNGTTPPKIREPHFFTDLTPFKCGVHIISTAKGHPASWLGPKEHPEAEFVFVDKNGYPSDFVENLIDCDTQMAIERQCIEETYHS